MPGGTERAPIEQETLIFDNPESAGRFRERVSQKTQEASPDIDNRRGVVGAELQKEFEAHGEGVDQLRRPWEHTQQEHAETQELIDMAFEKDLHTALRRARQSEHYPRNIDLFHDTLTNQMYRLVVEERLNKQGIGVWIIAIAGISLLALFGLGVLLVF